MANVVFSLENGQVTGVDRQPLAFEKEIKLPFDITLSKSVQDGVQKVQKQDANGNLLYMTNIVTDEEGELVSFDETTEAVEVLETEQQEVVNRWVGADGKQHNETVIVTVPTKTQDRNPVMIDQPVYKSVKFEDSFMDFTYQEVIEAKKKAINENSLYDLAYFNEELPAESFSTTLSSFNADLGRGVAVLAGGSKLRTEKVSLGSLVSALQIYTEADSDISVEVGDTATNFVPADGTVKFATAVDSVYVRFTNNSANKRELHAFGILV